MRDELSNGLDALIDEAARGLTAASPPASLRERVGASLPQRRSRRLASWPLVAATATLVVAAGVAVLRGPLSERDDEARLARAPGPAADVRLPVTALGADGGGAGRASMPSRVRRAAAAVPDPDPNPDPNPDLASDPLPIVVEPLVLSPIAGPDVRALALDSLPAPMPLALEPIVIEPLTLE